ncbi:porin [Paraburkholderia sp. J63]|uniref:porin n=1 Tax=Paraburkholderia sp. J63 TaxID=2805434 RepID=UPI002ABE61E0|nr:porin [Paraburkholderia sp. J63]
MKKWLFCAAVLGASSAAYAQSSVTLYGRIDTGLQYQTGMPQGNAFTMESGNWDSPRFGMMGTEDIGGATKVVFKLEAGFNSLNGGIGSTLFSREATVGLANDTWGTFKVGNMGAYELQQDSFDLDPQLMMLYGIQTLVRGRNWSTASNGLEYASPLLGGLRVKGQYDLTNSTTWNAGNPGSGPGQLGGAQGRSGGIELTYDTASAHLMAIYDEIRDSNGQFDNVYVNSRSIMAGGTYRIGAVTLYGGYQLLDAPQASNEGYFGDGAPTSLPAGTSPPTQASQEWLGARWYATAATSLGAAVYHTNANHGNGNATLYTLTATYSVSKRTTFYSEVATVRNSATSNIGLGDGYSDPYGANGVDDSASATTNTRTNPNFGGSQTGVFAGVVTRF